MPRPPLDSYASLLARPSCGAGLTLAAGTAACSGCVAAYRVEDGRVFLTEPPMDYENQGAGGSTPDPATWSAWRRSNHGFFSRVLSALPEGSTVIDIGAGPGQFGPLLERFARVIPVDFRPYEPVAVVADLTAPLPFKDGSVDAVVSSNTYEHLPDTAFALAEAFRVLKPGGILIATIPFLMRIHQKPYDFNRYTHYQLARLLGLAGFTDISVEPLSRPADVYRTAERHFFTYLARARPSRAWRLLARLVWRIRRVETALLRVLLDQAPSSPDFTEGYGLTARKPAG